jgi:hypothetical protein
MDEDQTLRQALERYEALRQLITDPQAITAIEQLIDETRLRLSEMERQGGPASQAPSQGRGDERNRH